MPVGICCCLSCATVKGEPVTYFRANAASKKSPSHSRGQGSFRNFSKYLPYATSAGVRPSFEFL